MLWDLPLTLEVGGFCYAIRADFRAALDIMVALSDPELSDAEKTQVMVEILYEELPPIEHLQEAVDKATWFLDCGMVHDDGRIRPKTMDWDQDAPIIFPAINKVAGIEVRAEKYIHWWTFYGWFMELHEGLFTQIVSIRQKRADRKKLEAWEKDFYTNNKHLIALKEKTTEEQKQQRQQDKQTVDSLFGRG